MVTYDAGTGIAYSDAEKFEDWCEELNLARENWMNLVMFKGAPQWVNVKAHSKNPKHVKEVQSWLRVNGWKLLEKPEELRYAISHEDKIVSEFRVSLQEPDREKCRLCGEPLAPGYRSDVHLECTIRANLETLVSKRYTVRGATLN